MPKHTIQQGEKQDSWIRRKVILIDIYFISKELIYILKYCTKENIKRYYLLSSSNVHVSHPNLLISLKKNGILENYFINLHSRPISKTNKSLL